MNFTIQVSKIKSYQTLVYKNGRNTFKKQEYKNYENEIFYQIKGNKLPFKVDNNVELELVFNHRLKNIGDIDNISKPVVDILQKRLNFNDKHIVALNAKKRHIKELKNDEIVIRLSEVL